MKWIKFVRTFREGFRNFHRDLWLSVTTVSVLTLSLYVIAVTLFLVLVGNTLLANVKERISVSAYLYSTVSEQRVSEITDELNNIRNVASVTFVSRQDALVEFKKTSTNEPFIRKALDELSDVGDGNPLFSSLIVKVKDPNDYDDLAVVLGASKYSDDIFEVNYGKNKATINQLNQFIYITKSVGATLSVIFVVIAILVVYNTIRVTMFSRRSEFEVMRLVGASNTYVQLPSVFEGVFYGLVAAIITMILLAVTAYSLMPIVSTMMMGTTLFGFYLLYFWKILAVTMITAVFLSVLSGSFAIKRYLNA